MFGKGKKPKQVQYITTVIEGDTYEDIIVIGDEKENLSGFVGTNANINNDSLWDSNVKCKDRYMRITNSRGERVGEALDDFTVDNDRMDAKMFADLVTARPVSDFQQGYGEVKKKIPSWYIYLGAGVIGAVAIILLVVVGGVV